MPGGFEITVTTENFAGAEDRSWLGTRKGVLDMRSVMLDVSTFLAAHLTDKGAIPSGTVLGKITATGLYGPYDNAAVDGREVAAGFLWSTTKVGNGTGADLATAPDTGVALFWTGVIKQSRLPLFAGTVLGELDAAGIVDLTPWFRIEA